MNAEPTTSERIKQAAVSLFAGSGYEGTSLSEIAKEVGIKTPSIYAHFKSKEQLFLQLIDEAITEERQQYTVLLQKIEQEPIKEQLYHLFDFFTDFNHLTNGQAFFKRSIVVPPRHLREQMRLNFLHHEHELSKGLLTLWRKGSLEGVFHSQDEARMIAAFYVCVDGLLVENQLYEEALYSKRKQMIWLSLWQLWTTTAREE